MCHVDNWMSDSQPSSMKMKELETIVDDLRSELAVKAKDMDTLRNEKKSVMEKYVQLKRKHNLKEDDSGKFPQPSVLDSSLQYDPEVCDITTGKYTKWLCVHIYYHGSVCACVHMCVCLCLCLCFCVCVCVCVYTSLHVCTYMCVYTYLCVHTCLRVCVCRVFVHM